MRQSTAVLALVLGAGLAASSCGKGSDNLTIWQADLLDSNETPPRATGASGTAGITFDQLIQEMKSGNAYVNFHTTRYPGGEVRGQTRLLQ